MPRPGRWRKRILIGFGAIVVVIIALTVLGLVVGAPPAAGQHHHHRRAAAGLVRLRYGQQAHLSPSWTQDGIVSATVYSFRLPFKSQTMNTPDADDRFALSAVQVCAGPHGASTSSELVPFPFALVYPHSQTTGALDAPDAAKEPDLGNAPSTLHPHQCVRGYVTFEYARKVKPLSVAWGGPDQPAYEWSATG
ncbi:MAG TPA: hypothetical protein VGG25_10395 [Streptosporangiaceae bacterium]|jgi:hypothetical protein